jgi:hypothetical protein
MTGRVATTAHPLCTCREHDHALDVCLGPQFIYRRPDGTEFQGECRILGGVEPSSRDACVMHGRHS